MPSNTSSNLKVKSTIISTTTNTPSIKSTGITKSGLRVFEQKTKKWHDFFKKPSILPAKIGERDITNIEDIKDFVAEKSLLKNDNSKQKSKMCQGIAFLYLTNNLLDENDNQLIELESILAQISEKSKLIEKDDKKSINHLKILNKNIALGIEKALIEVNENNLEQYLDNVLKIVDSNAYIKKALIADNILDKLISRVTKIASNRLVNNLRGFPQIKNSSLSKTLFEFIEKLKPDNKKEDIEKQTINKISEIIANTKDKLSAVEMHADTMSEINKEAYSLIADFQSSVSTYAPKQIKNEINHIKKLAQKSFAKSKKSNVLSDKYRKNASSDINFNIVNYPNEINTYRTKHLYASCLDILKNFNFATHQDSAIRLEQLTKMLTMKITSHASNTKGNGLEDIAFLYALNATKNKHNNNNFIEINVEKFFFEFDNFLMSISKTITNQKNINDTGLSHYANTTSNNLKQLFQSEIDITTFINNYTQATDKNNFIQDNLTDNTKIINIIKELTKKINSTDNKKTKKHLEAISSDLFKVLTNKINATLPQADSDDQVTNLDSILNVMNLLIQAKNADIQLQIGNIVLSNISNAIKKYSLENNRNKENETYMEPMYQPFETEYSSSQEDKDIDTLAQLYHTFAPENKYIAQCFKNERSAIKSIKSIRKTINDKYVSLLIQQIEEIEEPNTFSYITVKNTLTQLHKHNIYLETKNQAIMKAILNQHKQIMQKLFHDDDSSLQRYRYYSNNINAKAIGGLLEMSLFKKDGIDKKTSNKINLEVRKFILEIKKKL